MFKNTECEHGLSFFQKGIKCTIKVVHMTCAQYPKATQCSFLYTGHIGMTSMVHFPSVWMMKVCVHIHFFWTFFKTRLFMFH